MNNLPNDIVWDLTYACPLRCEYCYSESGRRKNKRENEQSFLDIAEKIIALKPERVAFSGGEPLLVKSVYSLADYFKSYGIRVTLYTSGYTIDCDNVGKILSCFPEIRVSLDCHIPEVNDKIRVKKGGTQQALKALNLLLSNRHNSSANVVGIDTVVVRENLPFLSRFCHYIAEAMPSMDFMNMGVCVPSGLANRQTFAKSQLLTLEQLELVRDPHFIQKLRMPFPKEKEQSITLTDNFSLLMSAKNIKRGSARVNAIHISPDGRVRGSLIYDGTVGHIIYDEISTIVKRIQDRLSDPYYVRALERIDSLQQWAERARAIDLHYTIGQEEYELIARRHGANYEKKSIQMIAEAIC